MKSHRPSLIAHRENRIARPAATAASAVEWICPSAIATALALLHSVFERSVDRPEQPTCEARPLRRVCRSHLGCASLEGWGIEPTEGWGTNGRRHPPGDGRHVTRSAALE